MCCISMFVCWINWKKKLLVVGRADITYWCVVAAAAVAATIVVAQLQGERGARPPLDNLLAYLHAHLGGGRALKSHI